MLSGSFETSALKRKACEFEHDTEQPATFRFAHGPNQLPLEALLQGASADALLQGAEAEGVLDSSEAEVASADVAVALEEISFLSSSMEPRDFGGQAPKSVCRFWLYHPTYCLQGDSCTNAHGLSELGLANEICVIKSGTTGATASVTIEDGFLHGAAAWKGSVWGAPKGSTAKGGWMTKGYNKGCTGKGGNIATGGQMALPASGGSRFQGGSFMPTKICQFWYQDPQACFRGAECSFAHGVHELQPAFAETCGVSRFHHSATKPTKMCTFFTNNACTRGLSCTFAHDAIELKGGAEVSNG